MYIHVNLLFFLSIKIQKRKNMKTHFSKIVTLLIIAFTACSKNDDTHNPIVYPITLSSEKQITGFQFSSVANLELTENMDGIINEITKTIIVTLPYGTGLTSLFPDIEISDSATITPIGGQNFSEPVTYTVTAEDESTTTYTVIVVIESILLTSIEVSTFELPMIYNSDNVLTSITTFVPSVGLTTNNVTVNSNHQVESIGSATYTYNSSGLLTEVNDGLGSITTLTYDLDVNFVMQSTSYSSELDTYDEIKELSYDTSGKVYEINISTTSSGVTEYVRFSISYDIFNNINEVIKDTSTDGVIYTNVETVTYSYDSKKNPYLNIIKEQLDFNNFYVAHTNLFNTIYFRNIQAYPINWISENNILSSVRTWALGTNITEYAYTYNEYDLPETMQVTESSGGTSINYTFNYNH